MLMDFFFDASPVARKRRAHFHEFMLDVHERVHVIRQKMKLGEFQDEDPIKLVADQLAEEAWLLCFDEFHVTDIADAMILGRLFTQLFEAGIVLVATSNVAPEDLYKDGLNRALFVPFIHMLEARMDVVRLDARTDFRLEKLGGKPVWYVPADAAADRALDAAWARLAGGHNGAAQDLPLRDLPPMAAACMCRAPSWGWRDSNFTICARNRLPPPIICVSRTNITPSFSTMCRR